MQLFLSFLISEAPYPGFPSGLRRSPCKSPSRISCPRQLWIYSPFVTLKSNACHFSCMDSELYKTEMNRAVPSDRLEWTVICKWDLLCFVHFKWRNWKLDCGCSRPGAPLRRPGSGARLSKHTAKLPTVLKMTFSWLLALLFSRAPTKLVQIASCCFYF